MVKKITEISSHQNNENEVVLASSHTWDCGVSRLVCEEISEGDVEKHNLEVHIKTQHGRAISQSQPAIHIRGVIYQILQLIQRFSLHFWKRSLYYFLNYKQVNSNNHQYILLQLLCIKIQINILFIMPCYYFERKMNNL